LFAFVVGGREVQVGLGDFDVVAKDLIEADFEGVDAGPLALALFHGGDDLFAVLGEIAEFVEFGVEAGANHAGIGGKSGGFIGDGALELVADVGEFVDFAMQMAEKFAAADGRGRDEIFQRGESCEGFAEGYEFARACLTKCDAAGEALEILDGAEFFADFAAHDGLLDEVGDGVEAGELRRNWFPYTMPFNITGHPALTVCCGYDGEGLPIGLQFVGRFRDEASVLRAAALYEVSEPWLDRWPDL